MTDNEALNHIAGTNEQIKYKTAQIESNTYNLVDALNQQMVYYSSPTLAYIQSGDRYMHEINTKIERCETGIGLLACIAILMLIWNFIVRCWK